MRGVDPYPETQHYPDGNTALDMESKDGLPLRLLYPILIIVKYLKSWRVNCKITHECGDSGRIKS